MGEDKILGIMEEESNRSCRGGCTGRVCSHCESVIRDLESNISFLQEKISDLKKRENSISRENLDSWKIVEDAHTCLDSFAVPEELDLVDRIRWLGSDDLDYRKYLELKERYE